LPRSFLAIFKIAFVACLTASTVAIAVGQIAIDSSPEVVAPPIGTSLKLGAMSGLLARRDSPPFPATAEEARHGLITRTLKRGLQDQKQLYLAPFKRSNLKWDALFLSGTAALLATDRQFSRALPTSHLDASRNLSNVCLDSTAAALIGLWAYGIKTKNRHAKETGELELETLANTFLIYTPMQFAAGRERPEEGTGNGRFWIHGGFNTSFPAGHPMFTWTMASVVAHEYPRTWVKLLAYGAATSVSAGRFFGREHFASDVFVGSILGYLIGAHIFHTRCEPGLSEACQR
jgi:membrane-associated phospholipid phosphatase